MLISSEEITAVLNKVRIVRETLPTKFPPADMQTLSVMDLHWVVQDIYGLRIEMLKVSFSGEHVRGKVERYNNKTARVLIRADQTPEFLRLVTVKELCHLMIDEQDDWSAIGTDTIKGLLQEWKLQAQNGVGDENPADVLQSEYLAEIAAIELMYPREFREADRQKLANKATTIAKIALEHDAPAYAIEQALRHHEILERCWVAIDAACGKAA